MAKKSEAQIRRLQSRALARGETYDRPEPAATAETSSSEEPPPSKSEDPPSNETFPDASLALRQRMDLVDSDPALNAKERRAAKRKAAALASEEWTSKTPSDPRTTTELLDAAQAIDEADVPKAESVPKPEPSASVSAAAVSLRRKMDSIDSESLNAKERRAAKRKAAAVAAEEWTARFPSESRTTTELLEMAQSLPDLAEPASSTITEGSAAAEPLLKKRNIPYILFIGQISYKSTAESLMRHFQDHLGKEKINEETFRVRLLTDAKTKKSKGTAFVQLEDATLKYECLTLHHTTLEGRRINVHKSTGGSNKELRKEKLTGFQKKQEEHISNTVDSILEEYKKTGDLREGELDAGVISLCKRHSAATVDGAISEYLEARGDTLDNPSAYLTKIIGRIAVDGKETEDERQKYKKRRRN